MCRRICHQVIVAFGMMACAIKFLFISKPADSDCATEHGSLWTWNAACTLGAILAATDPVAVVSALTTLGAPKKLSLIIDGESLMNDGSAMVVFLIFFEMLNGAKDHDVVSGALFFVQLAVGAPLFGLATFYAMYVVLQLTIEDWKVEVPVVLFTVYSTFYFAEVRHCRVIAGSLRGHCGVIAGSLPGHCRVIAGSLRGHCGVIAG